LEFVYKFLCYGFYSGGICFFDEKKC